MKSIICLLLFVCPYISKAQNGCTVGDTLPEMQWGTVMYSNTATINTAQFRGKWLLLNFWASWCSSCTKSFSKLDSLQEQFKNEVQILMVNPKESGDDVTKLERFFAKQLSSRNKPFRLPVVWSDTLAYGNFPFKLLPHCIWIDPNGVVRAITGKSFITVSNIQQVVAGNLPNWPIKKDWKD